MKLNIFCLGKHIYFFHEVDMDDQEVLDYLRKLDIAYGDTDQSVLDYAVEFSLAARMMLHHKELMVNPVRLALDLSEDGDLQHFLKKTLGKAAYQTLCGFQQGLNTSNELQYAARKAWFNNQSYVEV